MKALFRRRGSGACLVYLARKFDRRDWLPIEAAAMAEVLQWVFMAETGVQFRALLQLECSRY